MNEIKQYVRTGGKFSNGGQVKATFVAYRENNNIFIGYSSRRKTDRLNKELGLSIARNRARKYFNESHLKIPSFLTKDFDAFVNRCHTYYKGEDMIFPSWSFVNIEELDDKCEYVNV